MLCLKTNFQRGGGVKKDARKQLNLENIVDIKRPKLGKVMDVSIFRVLRYIALEDIVGPGGSGIVYNAGKRIGKCLKLESMDDFLDWTEKVGVGIVEVDKTGDPSKVDIYECITCSGISYIGRPVCYFEGGLIAGFLENKLGTKVIAKEVKCWGLGYEVCEFKILKLK